MNNNPFSEEYAKPEDSFQFKKVSTTEVFKEISSEIDSRYPLDKPRRYEIRARIIQNEND
ncbi:hypothetical protein [Legionella bononiensis]|uniref:Uncharacterized protein n=1 Tax=Legionella bononiensis TaxID=2793102 RepID=A0ABS1W8N3_9GAMM|nr:hypothetical protein [Legionella bononiensis]MBL7479766.1 hypothetical protein [Legionella bononiensis]MBL7525721.1 hypothetical protein [Legionella bononiensis]MBL7561903.1 hypothetical protein [Legionella bononiensis]